MNSLGGDANLKSHAEVIHLMIKDPVLQEVPTSTVEYVRKSITTSPHTAIILGSGLGRFAEQVDVSVTIPYDKIPNYPRPTVEGHSGELILASIGDDAVLLASGRFHLYEGYDMESVTLPVRLFHELGVKNLITTNAAGSVRKDFFPGTLMLIKGHLDFTFRQSSDLPQPVWDEAYHSQALLDIARSVAEREGIQFHMGVYAWTLGPSFETPAETDMIRELGGDAVGMSTVPEIWMAGELGLRVLGISCLTNYGAGLTVEPLTHLDVMETAHNTSEMFARLLTGIVEEIGGSYDRSQEHLKRI